MNKQMKLMALGLTILVGAAGLAGCGGSSSAPTTPAKDSTPAANSSTPAATPENTVTTDAKEYTVVIKNTLYHPQTLNIKKGTTVTWDNQDETDHSVWEGEPEGQNHLFKTEDLQAHQKFSYKFDKAGTFNVYCNTGAHYLLGMTMKVVVQ